MKDNIKSEKHIENNKIVDENIELEKINTNNKQSFSIMISIKLIILFLIFGFFTGIGFGKYKNYRINNIINKYLLWDSKKNYIYIQNKILNEFFDTFLIKLFENNFTKNFYANCDFFKNKEKIINYKDLGLNIKTRPSIFINISGLNFVKKINYQVEQQIEYNIYEDKFIINNIMPLNNNSNINGVEFCYLIVKDLEYIDRI